MPTLKLLANTVADNASIIDTYPTSTFLNSGANYKAITDGARDLFIENNSQIAYINKETNLEADTLILSKVSDATNISVYSYSDYPSGQTLINSDSSPEIIGDGDYIYSFSNTVTGDAFSVSLSTTERFNKVFLAKSVDITFIESNVEIVPTKESILIGQRFFRVKEIVRIILHQVDLATVSEIESLKLDTRCWFLYDETGSHLVEKLWYGVSPQLPTVNIYNDAYSIELEFYRLENK